MLRAAYDSARRPCLLALVPGAAFNPAPPAVPAHLALCLRIKLGGALPSARRPLLQPGCPLHQSPCRCSAHPALRKLSQSRADPFGHRLKLEALAWIAPSCACRYRFDCRMCPNNQIPHCAQIFGHRFLRRRNTASRPHLNSHTFVPQLFRSQ